MMPSSKRMMREFSLIRFYCVLTLSMMYFVGQLVTSHITHSLTLQLDAYHMLYNILSLITCILTVQMSRTSGPKGRITIESTTNSSTKEDSAKQKLKASALNNTFGWTRIDVCGAVATLCFLSALCFSLIVEALQTIFHVSHHKTMSDPYFFVGYAGVIGLAVNAICFFTIGGYTFHQSSFLSSNYGMGDEVVISASVQSYVQRGIKSRRRQGFMETVRDVFGTFFVIINAIIVMILEPEVHDPLSQHRWNNSTSSSSPSPLTVTSTQSYSNETETHDHSMEQKFAGYIDPGFCIVSVIILVTLSYSYAKEAGHILLLTIPDHIDVKSLLQELQSSFPEIYDIHDFHIWQLTSARIIASAHIVLQKTEGYLAIQNNVVDFLHTKGISHVTLQPEFLQLHPVGDSPATRRRKCFLPCDQEEDCREKQCCETTLTPCSSHNLFGAHHHHTDVEEPCSSSKPRNVSPHPIEMELIVNDEATNAEAELQPMI